MSIQKISFENYKKLPQLNMSSLCNIKKSPAHFQWCKENPKDSKSLIKGRAIHTLILEPETFHSVYAVEPEKKDYKFVTVEDIKQLCEKYGTKKTGKKEEILAALAPLITIDENKQVYDFAYSAFLMESNGKEILTAKEYMEARQAADSVLKSPRIRSMLKNGQSEVSILQTINDVEMKFRLDFMSENFILDVKSCSSCEEREFSRDFVNYQYAEKLSAYQKAVELETGKRPLVIVLAVETTEENDYQVFEIDQEFLDAGYKNFEKMLNTWKECTEKNEWPGMPKTVQKLFAPDWFLKQVYQ